MKKITLLLFACLFCLVSCQKDELAVPDETAVNKDDAVKAITKQGKILRAGYGFDLLEKESYDSHINEVFDQVGRTNNFTKGTKIVIELVDSEKDIERILIREKGFNIGFNQQEDANPGTGGNGGGGNTPPVEDGEVDVVLFGNTGNALAQNYPTFSDISFSLDVKRFLYQRIAKGSKRKSIIIRVTIPLRKDEVLRKRPRLSEDALYDINIGKFTFMDNYGPAWVAAETSAIEVFHVLNFNFTSLTKEETETASNAIALGIRPYFSFGFNNSLTNFQKSLIKKTFINQQVTTSLVGFAPKLLKPSDINQIFKKNGYQKEIQRMIRFANQNPFNVIPFKQTLRPHVDPTKDNVKQGPMNTFFRNEFNKMGRCTDILNKWTSLEARLELVKIKSTNRVMRNRANNALNGVRNQIRNAQKCKAKAPTRKQYGSIKL